MTWEKAFPGISSFMKQAWLRFKFSNHGRDLVNHDLDVFNHASPRMEDRGIGKRYINGEVGLHGHLYGRVGNLNPGEYCVVTEHRRID